MESKYLEKLVFVSNKRKRNGYGAVLEVFVGKTQERLTGMKVVSYSIHGKLEGQNHLSAAETFEIIADNGYKLKQCKEIK